jgi:2-(1,2-epoxy-1,2-dihydrophenyl)acetyl-CoA isomerase
MAVATEEMVLREVRDGIAWITLNRPDVANALAPEQRDQLIELFQAYSRDPGVRVVVLRSAGKHFCAGADLGRINA